MMLTVSDLATSHGAIQAVSDLCFNVSRGGVVTLICSEGAYDRLCIRRSVIYGHAHVAHAYETSLGLAPLIMHNVFLIIAAITKQKTTIVLTKWTAPLDREFSDHVYAPEHSKPVPSRQSGVLRDVTQLSPPIWDNARHVP